MKLLVLGGVDHNVSDKEFRLLKNLDPSEIHVLMMAGASRDVRRWAQENNVPVELVPIVWHEYKDRAVLTAIHKTFQDVDGVVLLPGGNNYDLTEEFEKPLYDWS